MWRAISGNLRAAVQVSKQVDVSKYMLLTCSYRTSEPTETTSKSWCFLAGSCAAISAAAAAAAGLLALPAYADRTPIPADTEQHVGSKEYTKEEVSKHRSKETGIWVTHKDRVYDITEFVDLHPGGAEKIMLAAGGSVDPFWMMYQQHKKQEVLEILEPYQIGRLKGYVAGSTPGKDPYSNEPGRHPALVARSERPYNAETPLSLLSENLITPSELFYVRNHLPVPKVDPSKYSLAISGEGVRELTLTLEDLKTKFKKYTVAATVQCAGNRRSELKGVRPVKGLDWDAGSIGTAEWGGVKLRDVLQAAGLADDDPAVNHVHFVGLDQDMTGQHYAGSIPVTKAMSSHGDVLLAYEMNGEPLPVDHGAPLRVIVPGVVGARNVKWLGQVIVSSEECSGFWQQQDYKSFSPSTDYDTVDWRSAPAIQETPVVSAVCFPTEGQEVVLGPGGELAVQGYAWSGGGRDIIRVDVSLDGGKHWVVAPLEQLPRQPGRAWSWSLWRTTLKVPESLTAGGVVEICCKATDESYNTQPESLSSVWNLRGLVNNAWHRVKVRVKQESRSAMDGRLLE